MHYPQRRYTTQVFFGEALPYLQDTTRCNSSHAIATQLLFTARRYASAVYAVVVCLSFCLSVRHKRGNLLNFGVHETTFLTE